MSAPISSTSSNTVANGLIGDPSQGASADERVYFDQTSSKWTFEADDGTEMEWDTNLNKWVPVLQDELVAAQQAAYSVAGVDEATPVAPVLAREEARKRKAEDKSDSKMSKKPRPPKPTRGTTAVFISHLPDNTTAATLSCVFSKAGLILEDAEGNQKIKLYYDEKGNFKGEALIVYLQEQSVELAVTLFDETELLLGSGERVLKVKKAEFEKREEDGAAANGAEKAEANGGKKQPNLEKQKQGKRAEKLKQKLTGWSSEEEDSAAVVARAKYNKLVVLQGMFTLKELEADTTLLLDLKEDVREECETLGEVTNVTLYDKEEDGIMTVRFKDELAAQACIARMNGRFFGGRSIVAFLFDGSKKYKKSGQANVLEGTGLGDADEIEREELAERERLKKYEKWLEEDAKKEKD